MIPTIEDLDLEAFSVLIRISIAGSKQQLHELYDMELEHVKALEEIGLKRVFFTEKHVNPSRPSPSQPAIIAAASQRTSRVRLGALVYVLPMRSPLLLAEEVSMLDHLCKGRLELGVGSGVDVGSRALACMKLDPEVAREMSIEATRFLIEYFKSGGARFSFKGRYYEFEDVLPPVMPYQRPHPPLWFPVRRREAVEWAAENGYNIVRGWLSWLRGTTREHFEHYRRTFESRASTSVNRKGPYLSLSKLVLVDKDDHRARQRGEVAIKRHLEYLFSEWSVRWTRAFTGSTPIDDFLLNELKTNVIDGNNAAEYAVNRGIAFIGAPDRVAAQMRRSLAESGANSFVLLTRFGDLSYSESLRTAEMLVNEVIPLLIRS
ncbi:MAG: LLM class flavin-dependent oxidoreductase [Aigarchaeota archaeon]|nr:LLM class flavin-dependent oxidoreductase [Candidatus Calditenuis fumarioli]